MATPKEYEFTKEQREAFETLLSKRTAMFREKYHPKATTEMLDTERAILECIERAEFGCPRQQVIDLVSAIVLHTTGKKPNLVLKRTLYGEKHGPNHAGEVMAVLVFQSATEIDANSVFINVPNNSYVLSGKCECKKQLGYEGNLRYATAEEVQLFIDHFFANLHAVNTNMLFFVKQFVDEAITAVQLLK